MSHSLSVLILCAFLVATLGCEEKPRATPTPAAAPEQLAVKPSDAGAAEAKMTRDEALRELEEYAQAQIVEGFRSRTEIIEASAEYVGMDYEAEDLTADATQITDKLLAARKNEEKTWATPTDCDRLETAFAALERSGVVARQNFSDCMTCGSSGIFDEIDAAKKKGQKPRGYVFFHSQDVESAAEGGALFLAYGAVSDSEKAALAVGDVVVSELKKAGLETSWNRDLGKRILVNVDWKKRRFTKPPAP